MKPPCEHILCSARLRIPKSRRNAFSLDPFSMSKHVTCFHLNHVKYRMYDLIEFNSEKTQWLVSAVFTSVLACRGKSSIIRCTTIRETTISRRHLALEHHDSNVFRGKLEFTLNLLPIIPRGLSLSWYGGPSIGSPLCRESWSLSSSRFKYFSFFLAITETSAWCTIQIWFDLNRFRK